jgi:hypothetical protein
VKHPTDKLFPGQDPSTSGPWTLYRDGVEILRGTERECWQYIHSHHSFSVEHACKYEGYTIKPSIWGERR